MTQEKDNWPPKFTLDQEKILTLLTGDRFYSNASAALRESILNAIDATHRQLQADSSFQPAIEVNFDLESQRLAISDNGDGMNQVDITDLFAKVGASAAEFDTNKGSVGEFGIGVISYFMAGDEFELDTFDGETHPIALKFTREMLAGGKSEPITSNRTSRGTTIVIKIRDPETMNLLIDRYPHWCRDVKDLNAVLLPKGEILSQGGVDRADAVEGLTTPNWVEKAHLSPIDGPKGWDSMLGYSTVSVLYRGVFVQEYRANGVWGIEGSIDVDPKHFKPSLNREGFIEKAFDVEIDSFLRSVHPELLRAMAGNLENSLSGLLTSWDVKRWATLWLSVPRDDAYSQAADSWDAIFRGVPAFELASGNDWKPLSFDELLGLSGEIYVAPQPDQNPTVVVNAAIRLLRHTKENVIRGLSRDGSYLKNVGSYFGTTADLITKVFEPELPTLKYLTNCAEDTIASVAIVAPLYVGEPKVDIVQLGMDGPPVLRLQTRLILNIDHPDGKAIVEEALIVNKGPGSLVEITARKSYENISQVAAAVRQSIGETHRLGLVRRDYIRGLLE